LLHEGQKPGTTTHTHTHTHTRTRTHARARAHTHTHTHTQFITFSYSKFGQTQGPELSWEEEKGVWRKPFCLAFFWTL